MLRAQLQSVVGGREREELASGGVPVPAVTGLGRMNNFKKNRKMNPIQNDKSS